MSTIQQDFLYFTPWIGANYETSTLGKLLLFGESGYSSDTNYINDKTKDRDIFIDVISKCQEGLYIKAYKNLGKLFHENSPMESFTDLAFVNGIQSLLASADTLPTKEEIMSIGDSFWFYLNEVEPEKLIVCSRRMWEDWFKKVGIDDDPRSKNIGSLDSKPRGSNVWKFTYKEGKSCIAIGINHPSAPFDNFVVSDWVPLVNDFLKIDPKFLISHES